VYKQADNELYVSELWQSR